MHVIKAHAKQGPVQLIIKENRNSVHWLLPFNEVMSCISQQALSWSSSLPVLDDILGKDPVSIVHHILIVACDVALHGETSQAAVVQLCVSVLAGVLH